MRTIRRKRSGALWTILYRGADPFGGAILPLMTVLKAIGILAWAKVGGLIDFFSAHDDDLVPWDPNNPEDYLDPNNPIHERLAAIKAETDKVELLMHMITCGLHGHPIFTAGGFTNRDPAIRLLAIKKALRAAWIGNCFGAKYITYWVARDGFESIICDPVDPDNNAYLWLKQALNIIAAACKANRYSIEYGTIEVKANEPRGYSHLPLAGTALALINELDDPDFWGQNVEIVQHSSMASQSPYLEVKQLVQLVNLVKSLLHKGKLFFLHLGGQIAGQFDNDFPTLVGENKEVLILIFRLLDLVGWDGVVEFDCHPLRSDLAPDLDEKGNEEIFKQFLRHNVEMYVMIERFLVPRLLNDSGLQAALAQLNKPAHSEQGCLAEYSSILKAPLDGFSVTRVIAAKVPAGAIMQTRQNHLAVERALNLALYGVSEEELAAAMEN